MSETTNNQILIYQAEDGAAVTEVWLAAESVWLTQKQMSKLFDKDQSVVSRHIRNVFTQGELVDEGNMQKMHIANSDKPVVLYSPNPQDFSKLCDYSMCKFCTYCRQ